MQKKKRIQCVTMSDGCCPLRLSSFPEIQRDKHTSVQETWVQSLDQEDSLEKKMVTHSSVLAWEIPQTEESGGLQSMRLQRVRYN